MSAPPSAGTGPADARCLALWFRLRIAACLALWVAAPARAQDTVEVTVRPGETCRSLAVRLYGHPAVELIHEHNPSLGPRPHQLVAGTILRVPRSGALAVLRATERRVERRLPDASTFEEARPGHELPRGTQVRTHERSSADLRFRDRVEVTVRERTLVIVYGGTRRLVERPIPRAELERGALRTRLGELAGRTPLEVDTPSSQASLEGDGVVSVEEDGTSRVANHGRRQATVRGAGGRVVLPAGTGTVVRRGERPSPPRRLLDAPRWRADVEGPVLGLVGRGASLRGGWEPVEGAAAYRVEVARLPDGGELVAALDLPGDAARFEADGLPEGTLYASVASIDGAGLEGRRSPWRAFTVRLARLVAPSGTPVELADVPPRVVPGTWLVAPRGVECALGEQPLGGMVTLRDAGLVAVRCRDAAGTELAPLAVQVAAPHVVLEGTLVRDRLARLTLTLAGRPVPPAHALALRAPAGFRVGRLEVEGDRLQAEVVTPPDAPEEVTVTLDVVAGAERVALATFELPVHDPAGAARHSVSNTEPTRGPMPLASALGDLAWPSALALRDERRRGISGWLYVAPVTTQGDPQLRVGAGARAHIPDTPVRLAFASQLDVLTRPSAVDRRGDADLLASLGLLVADGPTASLAVDASVWIPTRDEPASLGRVRLAPSLEASLRPADWLGVRTRQGAIVDATDDGARLWAFAVGADLMVLDWLGIGLELDGAVGRFVDRDGAALALGGGMELHLGLLELAFGARVALTDDARALFGDVAGIAAVRVVSR